MKYTVPILLLCLATAGIYLVMKPDSDLAASQVGTKVEKIDKVEARASDTQPVIVRVPLKSSPGNATVAAPSEATLRWRQDPELLAAIQADFVSTFEAKVLETQADAEARGLGDRAIRDAIASSGATVPGLQFRESDFASLPHDQKHNLAKLIDSVAYEYKEHGSEMPAGLTAEETEVFTDSLTRRSIYLPPEVVLDSLGLREQLANPDFVIQVRALRVRIYNQAALHLADLYNTTRYAIGAVMRQGVDVRTLGDFEGNAALVTPLVREHQLLLEALSREFVFGCDEIGRRFN